MARTQRVKPGTKMVRCLRGKRKPKVWSLSRNHSAETFRGNTDYYDWNSVEGGLSSKNRLIRVKVFLEIAVTEDDGPLRLFTLEMCIRDSRLVVSVAWWKATTTAKRTQQLCGVGN